MKMGQHFDKLLWVLTLAAGILLIGIVLLTDFEVLMRFAFNQGQSWVTEVINNLMVYITFLGTAWVLKQDGHVSVDVIYAKLSPNGRLILDLIVSLACTIACLIMTWYSGFTAIDSFIRNIRELTTVQAPRAVIIGIMPIGYFLLSIQFMRNFITYLGRWGSSAEYTIKLRD